jgi:hypothetical protein
MTWTTPTRFAHQVGRPDLLKTGRWAQRLRVAFMSPLL